MITVLMGLPGAGKSLSALWLMQQFLRAGRKVATNIELLPACPFYDEVVRLDDDPADPSEYCSPHPVFQERDESRRVPYKAFWHYMSPGYAYVIDEADNYWDSMDFAKLAESKDARLYFKQHRKRGDDVVLIVQNLDNLWNRIRRMAQKFIVCEFNRRSRPLMRLLPLSWSSFIRSEFAHESCTKKYHMGDGYFKYREAEAMFGWYRTEQLLGNIRSYNWKAGAS